MMMKRFSLLSLLIAIFMQISPAVKGCSCFLVTKGASADNSNYLTYTFDMHTHYGELYFFPAADHEPGSMVEIYEWDTEKFLGKIPQVEHTYNVVGNMNEFQVAMNETTYGGREELRDTTGIMDYGAMIFITLQRAKTAREAIRVMSTLSDEYGYYSSGETFSVVDKKEVWIVDFISKGMDEKGAVWVARKVPDGYVSGHANQSRITTFPLADGKKSITSKDWDKLNSPELECIYAHDVIDFARKKEYYTGKKDKDFSFADAYAPLNFGALRFCEARVWSMFNRVAEGMDQYISYAMGEDAGNRMPLWVKPGKKLSTREVMMVMRDHYENTPMSMTEDIGAGPYQCGIRHRPMTWEVDGQKYFHERAISTQQTAFTSIAQMRDDLPDPIGGVLWVGVDDTYSNCYTPMYCGIRAIPEGYKVVNDGIFKFDWNSAHWIFNLVTNWAYSRYQPMMEDIHKVQGELENKYITYLNATDKAAVALYNESPETAIQYITDYSVALGNQTIDRWQELAKYLIVKYIDGNVKLEENGKFKRNPYGFTPFPKQPGYNKEYYRTIVKDRGEKMKYPEGEDH